MILSGCLFLVYFCSCTVHSQTRASVLYCLLSQTGRSLDSQTRATALHRLLSQAVCSLMTQEKQMPPYSGACFSPAPLSYSPKLLSVNVFSSVIHHSACKVCHLISHAPQVPADDHAFGASFTQEYGHFSIIYLPHMIPELIIGNIFTSTDPFFFIQPWFP